MEELVTLKTAKLAKEKGFNTLCWDYINLEGEKESAMNFIGDTFDEKFIFAEEFVDYFLPSQSVLAKWLREVHKIRVLPYQGVSGNFKVDIFTYPIPNTVGKWERFNNIQSYNTFEQALEEGLFEALKLIK